jgi:hypothetical protein
LPAGLSWYWEVKRNITFAGIISFRRSWTAEERKNIMFIKRSFKFKNPLFVNSKLKFHVIWKKPEKSKKNIYRRHKMEDNHSSIFSHFVIKKYQKLDVFFAYSYAVKY